MRLSSYFPVIQAHADTASLLIKNVYHPLAEVAGYKKSQSKKLVAFRENYELALERSGEGVQQVGQKVGRR